MATANLNFTIAPNPIATSGQLEFDLPESAEMRISLFDVRGAEIKVLSQRTFTSGVHKVVLELQDLPGGNYYLRIQGGSWVKSLPLIKT